MNGKWIWVSAALLCTTIASAYAAVSYHSQADSYRENYQALLQDLEGLTILIDMKIDYGNGTSVWYNDTRVPLESNLLTATQIVATVDYSTSELGVFVNGINGVRGEPETYWIWSYWDTEKESWEMGPVGCGQWALGNGDIVSWIYTSF